MTIVADTMHGTMFFNTKTELRDRLKWVKDHCK